MLIPDEVIEAVRAATDIVEVVAEHLPLKQAGKRYKTLCPFHTEKTPSFTVNPELQMFHCFGCGVGGNVFTFLMRHLGLTFPEAVELLAARAGIALPRRPGGPAAGGGTGKVLAALEEAARLFEHNLWDRQAGARARRYLEERGLEEATARTARLGFAMAGFDHLRHRLGSRFDLKILVDAGLLVDREGGRPYDRFRDRLVFPILGSGGRPVGFGARSLDGSEPKYLNSPETSVYRKRNILYGLHLARQAGTRADLILVVEGYMDVLSLRQAGLEHVVAVSGTALTDAQARTLARYVHRVLLIFDGDEAGRKAVVRSLPALVGEGLQVRVALLPIGDDPDSLVRRGGREAMEEATRDASSVVHCIVSLCQKPHTDEAADPREPGAGGRIPILSPEAREAALRQIVEVSSRAPDRMARRLIVEEAARRLAFDEATLAAEVEGRRRAGGDPRFGRRPGGRPGTRRAAGPPAADATSAAAGGRGPARRPRDGRAAALLGLALADRGVLERLCREVHPEAFSDGPLRRLFQLLVERHARGAAVSPAALLGGDDSDPETAQLLARISVEPIPDDRQRAGEELIRSLVTERRRHEVERLQTEIRDLENAGRADEVPPLLRRIQELKLMDQSGPARTAG